MQSKGQARNKKQIKLGITRNHKKTTRRPNRVFGLDSIYNIRKMKEISE